MCLSKFVCECGMPASARKRQKRSSTWKLTWTSCKKLKWMVYWNYFQRAAHSRFPKLCNGKHPGDFLLLTHCDRPATAANRPFTWKLLLGMQTVAAPPGGQTDRNINMLHDWTYWRRTRILAAVLRIVQHCAQQYSQRSLVQHTVSVSWTLSHFKQKTDIWRLFCGFTGHAPTDDGAGLQLQAQPPLVGRNFSRATVKKKHLDFSSTVFLNWLKHWHQKPSTCSQDMEDQPQLYLVRFGPPYVSPSWKLRFCD